MSRFPLGAQPTPIIFNITTNMNGSPISNGTVTKDAKGRIVFDASVGVQLPFNENVEILRIVPKTKDVEIYVLEVDGVTEKLIKTVTAASPFVGSFIMNGAEEVRFKAAGGGAAQFQILARAFGKGQF